jgi:CO dehydrogenase maturation factor
VELLRKWWTTWLVGCRIDLLISSEGGPVKLAVSGKGGVGKTTVAALLASALHAAGRQVTAIDVDPDCNLLASLGYPAPETVPPLVELKDLIEERTGVKPGTTGGMFRMNPAVDDIPTRYGVDVNGVTVLVAGSVKQGGSGCYCPENALVRTLISHLLLNDNASLVLDMEAGVEHLGRGTVEAVDSLLVVVEPGRRSIETAARIRTMAADIGLTQVWAVGNKVRSEEDKTFLEENVVDLPLAACLPYDDRIRNAEREGRSILDAGQAMTGAVEELMLSLQNNAG